MVFRMLWSRCIFCWVRTLGLLSIIKALWHCSLHFRDSASSGIHAFKGCMEGSLGSVNLNTLWWLLEDKMPIRQYVSYPRGIFVVEVCSKYAHMCIQHLPYVLHDFPSVYSVWFSVKPATPEEFFILHLSPRTTQCNVFHDSTHVKFSCLIIMVCDDITFCFKRRWIWILWVI